MLKHFLIASVLTVTCIPTSSAFFLPEGGSFTTSDGTKVDIPLTHSKRDRLHLDRAMDIYREYVRQGVDGLIEPNINDPESIDLYLLHSYPPRLMREQGQPLSTTDYVRKETDVITLQSITRKQRTALRRSSKIGKCWRDPLLSSKLYALCLEFIKGKEQKRTTGFESDTAPSRRQPLP